MEQIPTPQKLPQIIEAELDKKITLAKYNCLTLQEEKNINDILLEGVKIEAKRELTDDEEKYYYSFRERLDKASVIVNTLPEARRVMELLEFDDDSLINTLSHENAHVNKALQVGARFGGYRFVLVRDVDGYLLVFPMAITPIPGEWDEKTRRKLVPLIIRAPDEYGNKMSEGDKQELRIRYGE